ncbi:hypothetical protein HCR_02890 [Hydrogenimonas cancrithermarum]|uniref:Uncharacterized protein n=2 Tax=Hydrogenimonas cancrithermarum TaxID=2993563 RepID=A0ABN6WUZ5_9BACT|nr:hypothetical protein HCR_02890 [Hydrogenimonas cancrithermarum]
MARRPLFIATKDPDMPVKVVDVEFEWFAGMNVKRKRLCIASLHEAAAQLYGVPNGRILEISSKSENHLGAAMSAFNLSVDAGNGASVSVESIFQGSKVFERGGPYTEIYGMSARQAKKYEKLYDSGNLLYFLRKGERWDLEPRTAFYDWVYLNALVRNPKLAEAVMAYEAFTDIEFNPKKSINCQAASAALFVSLVSLGVIVEALSGKESFLEMTRGHAPREKGRLL